MEGRRMPQEKLEFRRSVLVAFQFVVWICCLVVVGIAIVVVSNAQARPPAQSTPTPSQVQERLLEYIVPSEVPIRIEVQNSQKVKDLQNANWLRDFGIKVTNTGSKPIYFMVFGVGMPEVITPGGKPLGFSLWYGRPELIDVTKKLASPADIPIKPGESTILRIEESNLKAWERERASGHLADALKIIIHSQTIGFGDGTGISPSL
jgi:hypothetical protein